MNMPLRILLLEDEASDAALAEMYLADGGFAFDLHCVWERDAFVRALQEFGPDIVISDFRLPSFDGFSALEIVRRDHAHLPFIFMTGAVGEDVAVEAIRRGASDYILKDRPGRLPSAVLRAVQERRDREIARSHEERFRSVVNAAPEAIVLADGNDCIIEWNRGAERIFGYAASEVIGQPVGILMPERFRGTHAKAMALYAPGGVETLPPMRTLHAQHKNGTEFPIEMSLSTWEMEGRRFFGAVIRDVTEKQRMAQELEEHRSHLANLLARSTADLMRANASLTHAKEAAEANSRAKSAFLANMSHEIRTPMNAILGFVNLMQQGAVTDEQADRLGKIENAAQLLLGIINDILDLSKIEAGKMQLAVAPLLPEKHVGQVADLMRERASAKGLALDVEVEPLPQPLYGDVTRLQQMMLNFVSNAVKFTDQGRVTLRLKAEHADDQRVVLRFETEDTGMGIRPDDLARIFDAFEQAEASTARKHGGTGLGLAINRSLAQLMRGRTGAQSVPGKGSLFWFTAALSRRSEGRAAQAVPSGAPLSADSIELLRRQHAGVRILVVDDDMMNCEVASLQLEALGFQVETEENGLKAVNRLGRERFDLVLMDMEMPTMSGIEATQRIRALPDCGSLPILAMTANAFTEDREKCLAAGMNDFIVKPVKPQVLAATLQRWLSGRQAGVGR